MVQTSLALGVLQLVALALPAYAILIQLMVESDIPYANQALSVVRGASPSSSSGASSS